MSLPAPKITSAPPPPKLTIDPPKAMTVPKDDTTSKQASRSGRSSLRIDPLAPATSATGLNLPRI